MSRATTRERGLEGIVSLLGLQYNYESACERCASPLFSVHHRWRSGQLI